MICSASHLNMHGLKKYTLSQAPQALYLEYPQDEFIFYPTKGVSRCLTSFQTLKTKSENCVSWFPSISVPNPTKYTWDRFIIAEHVLGFLSPHPEWFTSRWVTPSRVTPSRVTQSGLPRGGYPKVATLWWLPWGGYHKVATPMWLPKGGYPKDSAKSSSEVLTSSHGKITVL